MRTLSQETKAILLLLILPPMVGELLSGSTPPIPFFAGGVFFLVLLYGCGTLLIREAKARWNVQWSVIFLAAAYGIVEEGTMVQSFFNVDHVDLNALSGYGMYFGVQWPWSIALTLYHATVSTLFPIVIVEYLFPQCKGPLLRKRGTALCLAGLVFIILFWVVIGVLLKEFPGYQNYSLSYTLNAATLGVVALLVWLAYAFRKSRVVARTHGFSPFAFGAFGFLIMALNLLLPNVLAAFAPGVVTIAFQAVFVAGVLAFVVYQVYNENTTKRHIVSLVMGSLFFYILLTPLHELGGNGSSEPTTGMAFVGTSALVLLVLWRRRVLKKDKDAQQPIFYESRKM